MYRRYANKFNINESFTEPTTTTISPHSLGYKGNCKNSCGEQSSTGPCYCDDICKNYGDCCADHNPVTKESKYCNYNSEFQCPPKCYENKIVPTTTTTPTTTTPTTTTPTTTTTTPTTTTTTTTPTTTTTTKSKYTLDQAMGLIQTLQEKISSFNNLHKSHDERLHMLWKKSWDSKLLGQKNEKQIQTHQEKFIDYGEILEKVRSDGKNMKGIISMWSGALKDIPVGWVLCDGNNNTPDLRGRFVLGKKDNTYIGDKGGEETVTLTKDQIPKHEHRYSLEAGIYTGPNNPKSMLYKYNRNARSHNREAKGWGHTLDLGGGSVRTQLSINKDPNDPFDKKLDHNTVGKDKPHNNMPPYYVLAYIMKT